MSQTAGDRVSSSSLWQQLVSFNFTFWVANAIEMFERLAYYGLRTVIPIYMVLALEESGPQFDHIQKGAIFGWWALVQSGVPVFTGGYADRYGYKLTVAISIAIKIVGYLVMAYAVDIAGYLTGGASLGVPGHSTTYHIFLAGALLLALGTAVFKPGIQGILAHQMDKDNESTGWAVFYQLVNLGAWFGPFLAGYLRLLDWKYVFVACAIIVSFNYILLLFFPEPEGEQSRDDSQGVLGAAKVLWHSGIGICEPRLMSFLVVFSGFWFMFNQLFDMLPNFIDQWVDSSGVLNAVAAPLMGLVGIGVPAEWGGNLPQEYMINLNAGMIMFLAFAVGYLTGKVRSMTAMIVGIVLSAFAIWVIGWSMNGWVVLGSIAMFSVGEMIASPTKMRYFASIAPPGKKGMYLGYINATNGIGWFIGSRVAGELYEKGGDIVVLARRHLTETLGMDAATVDALAKTEVLPLLAERTRLTAPEVQQLLWDTYSPQAIWTYFAIVGMVSMLGLVIYDQITRRNLSAEPWFLLALTGGISWYSYGWTWALGFLAVMGFYMVLERQAPHLLPQGQTTQDEENKAAAS